MPRRQREAVDGRASGKRIGVGDCPEMERVAVHPTLDRHLRGLHELLDEHHVPHGQGIAVGIDGDAEEGSVLPRPGRVFGRRLRIAKERRYVHGIVRVKGVDQLDVVRCPAPRPAVDPALDFFSHVLFERLDTM